MLRKLYDMEFVNVSDYESERHNEMWSGKVSTVLPNKVGIKRIFYV
jgi:hypothetical protein